MKKFESTLYLAKPRLQSLATVDPGWLNVKPVRGAACSKKDPRAYDEIQPN